MPRRPRSIRATRSQEAWAARYRAKLAKVRAARPGIVPLGEIEKTLFGERIGILGQTAGKHRPLPEKLTIH